MNTSYSLQSNASELLSVARKRHYGENASSKDYRDNFILGNEILAFPLGKVDCLLAYKDRDINSPKTARSVTLKANAYDRLVKVADLLGLSESEACRLIIYYIAENHEVETRTMPNKIEEEIAALKKALDEANRALAAIENYYTRENE